MKFCKIQGNGNDFIVIENFQSRYTSSQLSEMAMKICRRRQSLGADGILVLEGSQRADFTMRLFNSDGSEGEMCGNGARCIARYAFKQGIAPSVMSFETLAGVMGATVDEPYVTLDMGRIDLSGAVWEGIITTCNGRVKYSFLNVGVPHCVIWTETLAESSREYLVTLGRSIRNNQDIFPQGTNVNFAELAGPGDINVVTYERGVEDLTESCGTGSTASAIVSCHLFGLTSPVKVHNPGGINEVFLDFQAEENCCNAGLKGRTVIIAKGDITQEALV